MRWGEFEKERPDLGAEGKRLLYQFGVGLGFLATTARNGSPRVHPMCPVFVGDGIYGLIEPGPKRGDLHRDGRYALHCFPPAVNEDAFYITGRASHIVDAALIADAGGVFFLEERKLAEIPPQSTTELFEFDIERCLVTRTTGHGDWNPHHDIWRAK